MAASIYSSRSAFHVEVDRLKPHYVLHVRTDLARIPRYRNLPSAASLYCIARDYKQAGHLRTAWTMYAAVALAVADECATRKIPLYYYAEGLKLPIK